MCACTCSCIRVSLSTTLSFAPPLLASGRAAAQQEELASLRATNQTFTNDVRLNNIRQSADGGAAQSMGLLQFASTLQASINANKPDEEKASFNAMAALGAMQGGSAVQGGPSPGDKHPLLGYGGAAGAEQRAEEQKKRDKEKKRKRKAKKKEKKAKKEAKISELVNQQGMTYERASNLVEDAYESSDSSSSSS